MVQNMQRWSSWLMASASKAEEPQGSGGSNPSRCVRDCTKVTCTKFFAEKASQNLRVSRGTLRIFGWRFRGKGQIVNLIGD